VDKKDICSQLCGKFEIFARNCTKCGQNKQFEHNFATIDWQNAVWHLSKNARCGIIRASSKGVFNCAFALVEIGTKNVWMACC